VNGQPALVDGGSTGTPNTLIFNAGFGDNGSGYSSNTGIYFNDDGSVRPYAGFADQYNYAPVNYIQLPQTRYQSMAIGHFDIDDKTTVYGRAMFTSSKVPQQLAPTPAFVTSTFTVDGSPFLTPDAQQIISDGIGDGVDTDGDGIDDTATALVRRRLEEVGPRINDSSSASFQLQTGVTYDITDTWSADAFVQYGNTNFDTQQSGNVSLARFNQALLLDLSDPTGNTCADPSSSGGDGPCAPVNIFGTGNISAAGASFLRTATAASADYEQLTTGVTFSGDLGDFELPGGDIGIAFGIEHREDEFAFRPSQDLATSNIAGFNGSPPVSGGFDVDEIFVEAYLPILSGAPFAEILDLELAFRSSDYSTIGSVETYKIAGSWAPNDQVRFRGGFNRAVRAPNIGELFQPQAEGFPGATDPCSSLAADQSAAVEAICVATGVPAAEVFSPGLDLAAGQVRALAGGNPNLDAETADTMTFGVVFTPAAIEGLSVSVDYFNIEIEEAIAAFGGGASNILNVCYDPADPSGGAGSAFCNVINRRPDGTIDFVETLSQNVASITLSGIDLITSYNTELWGGDLRVDYVGTFTQESDTVPFAGAQTIECAGNFGTICGEPLPEYKHRMTFNWARDEYVVQLSWRQIGEVNDDDAGATYFVETIDSQPYFDLVGSYQISDSYSVSVGIDNVLDDEPPILGDNQEQANTWPATYDVFGRTWFVRASAEF
jgi:outer membrane receptor protein involved in Fe transport